MTRPPHDLLCQHCEEELSSSQPVCRSCALPLNDASNLLCGACQKTSPAYHSVYRYAPYGAPLDRLILQFKFRQKLAIGNKLGRLMALDIKRQKLQLPDVLVPVPLHATRLRQRGYNQALELAQQFVKSGARRVDVWVCARAIL